MRIEKELAKAFLVGIVVFIVLSVIQYINGFTINSFKHLFVLFLYNQLYAVILYMANAYYFGYLLKKFPNKVFKPKNLLKGILGGIIITLVAIFIIRIITQVIIGGDSFFDFVASEKVGYYYISFIISVVVTIVFYTYFYYKNKQQSIVKAQKLIAGTASAKFDALKNQLDPHFLFNSLNVLTSLIEENPQAATRFTTSLSKVYRYVLEQKNKELVTLQEELNFAKLYMSLLAVRFEDSIVFTAPETLENPEAKVVPLSLQLVLENAVKHNRVTPSKKLYVEIAIRNGNLVVINNSQPKQIIKKSTGIGLINIRERYALLTDQPVVVNKTAKEFSIEIPILEESTKIMNTSQTYISEKKYKRAKERVEKLKGFYLHLAIYLLFVPVFIYLNHISRAGFPWAIFPIAGWGMGVVGHAAETFNYNPFFGKDWEQRKIQELMEKEDANSD